eukprot:TRINITY_DN6361_c0_g1_i3.p1 TRINITY_DN6361_c0_g1~~TRINITY_DN6361_c0_g1_i3.p1  ORF type:complete len:159 (+),score=40.82 TRINITY_DN6361_c0_g1_i3:119-595(+)
MQERLEWYKKTLEMAGAEVFLDVYDMEGGIKHAMKTNIEAADKYMLMCTPSLQARVKETNKNNMVYELECALEKQKTNPSFILPVIVEGSFSESVPTELDGRDVRGIFRDILAITHLKNPDNKELLALKPAGLLPIVFELKKDPLYKVLVREFDPSFV